MFETYGLALKLNEVQQFAAKIDTPTWIAISALALSAVLGVVTATLLWRNRGGPTMGKVRKRLQERKIADKVVDLIEQMKADNDITDEEGKRYYKRLASVFRIPDLRNGNKPPEPSLKERLMERQLTQNFLRRGTKGNGKIPGDPPTPVKTTKKKIVVKPEDAKKGVFSFFRR
jgi:hypothetical protein